MTIEIQKFYDYHLENYTIDEICELRINLREIGNHEIEHSALGVAKSKNETSIGLQPGLGNGYIPEPEPEILLMEAPKKMKFKIELDDLSERKKIPFVLSKGIFKKNSKQLSEMAYEEGSHKIPPKSSVRDRDTDSKRSKMDLDSSYDRIPSELPLEDEGVAIYLNKLQKGTNLEMIEQVEQETKEKSD